MTVKKATSYSGPPRAAVYVRVSSVHQAEEGTSLDTQEAACREHAAAKGYVVTEVYREVYTGVELWDRPRLTVLRASIRRGEVDAVIVYAIDRLAREPVHLGVIISEADHAGVSVEFVTEVLDDSPEGQLIRFVRGYAAKVEHEKIRERTMRGTRERVRRGRPLAGGAAPYGLRWKPDVLDVTGKVVIAKPGFEEDPGTVHVIRRIFGATMGGSTLRALAMALDADGIPTPTGRGRWIHTTLRAILLNPVYTGRPAAYRTRRAKVNGHSPKLVRRRPTEDWVRLPDGVAPSLVDEATFEAIQYRLTANKHRVRRSHDEPEVALLRGGFIRCGLCGWSMIVRHGRSTHYRCGRSLQANAGRGHSHTMAASLIDAIVWQKVESLLLNPSTISAELARLRQDDPTEGDLLAVDRAIAETERKMSNLVEQLADLGGAAAGMIRERLVALETQRQLLVADRASIQERRRGWLVAQDRITGLDDWVRQIARNLRDLSMEQKRLALEALGVRVRVWGKGNPHRWEITTAIDLGVVTDQDGVIVDKTMRGALWPPPRLRQ